MDDAPFAFAANPDLGAIARRLQHVSRLQYDPLVIGVEQQDGIFCNGADHNLRKVDTVQAFCRRQQGPLIICPAREIPNQFARQRGGKSV